MKVLDQTQVHNRLLKAIQASDFERIKPHLEYVDLPTRKFLVKSQEVVKHFYFVEEGIVSVTGHGEGGRIEVGFLGREGVVGAIPVLLGSDSIPYDHFVQIPGAALRIPVEIVKTVVDQSSDLRNLLLRYVLTEVIQLRQTAIASASFEIEARLPRWLLMCHDRVDNDEIAITHEFLSMMLGVRRAGVTLALQQLEGAGRIKARRGRVTIQNRKLLEEIAHTSYGTPEAEYVRLVEGGKR